MNVDDPAPGGRRRVRVLTEIRNEERDRERERGSDGEDEDEEMTVTRNGMGFLFWDFCAAYCPLLTSTTKQSLLRSLQYQSYC